MGVPTTGRLSERRSRSSATQETTPQPRSSVYAQSCSSTALDSTAAALSTAPDIREDVPIIHRDLAHLHVHGQISARWLITKVEQHVVTADNVDDYLDQPLNATSSTRPLDIETGRHRA